MTLRFEELENGKAVHVDIDGIPVAVVRIDDEVFAVHDQCSHADVRLSEGIVWCETKQIECIRHGSAFSLETGHPDTLPATQPVATYAVTIRDGEVVVNTGGCK
jgi:3-phenylpropionate/trans-cinnamate dioxygenase ferredoxin subunit